MTEAEENEKSPLDLLLLKLNSFEPLKNAIRKRCGKCGKMRKFFCYDCLVAMLDCFPRVKLPEKFHVHVIRHYGELRSKSSAIPLGIVCPENIHIYTTYRDGDERLLKVAGIPDSMSCNNTVLLFPDASAECVDDVNWHEISNVIVLDSTWAQSSSMVDLVENMYGCIRKVRLSQNLSTTFWRYQSKNRDFLATAEAIYLLIKEACGTCPYDGSYDNLLWFYAFNHSFITTSVSLSKRIPSSFKAER